METGQKHLLPVPRLLSDPLRDASQEFAIDGEDNNFSFPHRGDILARGACLVLFNKFDRNISTLSCISYYVRSRSMELRNFLYMPRFVILIIRLRTCIGKKKE